MSKVRTSQGDSSVSEQPKMSFLVFAQVNRPRTMLTKNFLRIARVKVNFFLFGLDEFLMPVTLLPVEL